MLAGWDLAPMPRLPFLRRSLMWTGLGGLLLGALEANLAATSRKARFPENSNGREQGVQHRAAMPQLLLPTLELGAMAQRFAGVVKRMFGL